MDHDIRIETITWHGIVIEISYEPVWFNMESGFNSPAHLELRVIEPERAALPVTQTGYRSHFLAPEEIDAAGGPTDYVRAWLDEAANSKAWQDAQEAARQLSFF